MQLTHTLGNHCHGNLIVVSLVLGGVACGGSKSDTEKSAALAKSAELQPGIVGRVDPDRGAQYGNTKISNVAVKLLEPGTEPGRQLKYEVKPNYVAFASSRIAMENQEDKTRLRQPPRSMRRHKMSAASKSKGRRFARANGAP